MKKVSVGLILIVAFVSVGLAQHGEHGYGDEEDHHNHMGQVMNHNLVFPHITMGQGYQTKLTLMNPGTGIDISGTLYFYGQDGSALQVTYQGQMVGSIPLTIPQGGFESIILGNPDDLQTRGWAVFINDEDFSEHEDSMHGSGMDSMYMGDHLFGGIIYSRYQANLVTQVGTMATRFMDGMHKGFALPVTNDRNNVTGLVVLNTTDTQLPVQLTLKNRSGGEVHQRNLVLMPGQQMVDIVAAYFPEFEGISEFHGTLELRAEFDGLVPLALVNTNGIQTAIPFIRIPDALGHWDGHGHME